MDLKNKTALITGGTQGLGLALAQALVECGCRVFTCGRSEELVKQCQKRFPRIQFHRCNITDREDFDSYLKTVLNRAHAIQILVNNAGVQHPMSFVNGTDNHEHIAEEINTNFTAHVQVTNSLMPYLLKNTEGSAVVNVTSILATVPKQSTPVYCATKAAMRSFSRTLRYQTEGRGMKVFDVIPAVVTTEMTKGRAGIKVPPEYVASKIIKGLCDDKFEIVVERAKFIYTLHRVFPSMAYWVLKGG